MGPWSMFMASTRMPREVLDNKFSLMKIFRVPFQLVLGLAVLASGCSRSPEPAQERTATLADARATESASPSAASLDEADDARPRIVFLGDSLTAGYGLQRSEAVPTLIQERLDAAGYRYRVVNAGVSGDTSAG